MPETLRLPEDCILFLGKEMEIFFLKNNREYIFKKEYEDYGNPRNHFGAKKFSLKPITRTTRDHREDNILRACDFEYIDLTKGKPAPELLAKSRKLYQLFRGEKIDTRNNGVLIILAITPKEIALLWVFNQLTADHYLRLAKAQARKERINFQYRNQLMPLRN